VDRDEIDTAAVATAHRREHGRWECSQAVEIVRTSGTSHPRWPATVVDASEGGLGLLCGPIEVIGPGTELMVRCADGNWAAARVRHCADLPSGLRLGVTVTRASGQLSSLFPPERSA
jgi:hypothetical protein